MAYMSLTYNLNFAMLIIETPIFTRLVESLLNDEEYRKLQGCLCLAPQAGNIIRGSGGLRKIRWAHGQRGKRGGVRVIYYWVTNSEKILMLYIYPKNRQIDLTPEQVKLLSSLLTKSLRGAEGDEAIS